MQFNRNSRHNQVINHTIDTKYALEKLQLEVKTLAFKQLLYHTLK